MRERQAFSSLVIWKTESVLSAAPFPYLMAFFLIFGEKRNFLYLFLDILSLVFSIAFGTCFTVLFWFRNAQLGDKVKEVEQQKKDYQEFVNRGHYKKEKNPNSWKKWESGEVKYTPAPVERP